MAEEKEEIALRYLIPVEKVPTKRAPRTTLYDDIIKEFIESKLRYAEVREMGRRPLTILYNLKEKLKEKGIENIKARYRNKKVYLERLE